MYSSSGSGTFVNAGTWEETASTNATFVGVPVTNTGSISVQSDIVYFTGSGSSTGGNFTASSGATLYFEFGTWTIDGGTAMNGTWS